MGWKRSNASTRVKPKIRETNECYGNKLKKFKSKTKTNPNKIKFRLVLSECDKYEGLFSINFIVKDKSIAPHCLKFFN